MMVMMVMLMIRVLMMGMMMVYGDDDGFSALYDQDEDRLKNESFRAR